MLDKESTEYKHILKITKSVIKKTPFKNYKIVASVNPVARVKNYLTEYYKIGNKVLPLSFMLSQDGKHVDVSKIDTHTQTRHELAYFSLDELMKEEEEKKVEKEKLSKIVDSSSVSKGVATKKVSKSTTKSKKETTTKTKAKPKSKSASSVKKAKTK